MRDKELGIKKGASRDRVVEERGLSERGWQVTDRVIAVVHYICLLRNRAKGLAEYQLDESFCLICELADFSAASHGLCIITKRPKSVKYLGNVFIYSRYLGMS